MITIPRKAVLAVLATVLATGAACGSEEATTKLELSAALPDKVPSGTTLRIGDPQIQAILGASGLDEELSAAGITTEWANISGGPQSIQAFRADKLDCSSVADIPSLFAAWTGTSTKIVFQAVTIDPLDHPIYKLGVAPGVNVASLADLRGKKIAYSAGQAQGALVLRVLQKAGLSQKDVQLIELTSTGDSYVTSLGTKAVDVAPIGAQNIKLYEAKYPGATSINTGIRDDASTLYCLTTAVEDADRAAALKVYVGIRTKALLWANDHPAEFAKAYYQDSQKLSAADAKAVVEINGDKGIPATWDNAIKRLQETADLLATEQKHDKLDVTTLVDRRFEKVQADAAGDRVVTGDAT
ncbi:sulfonate ABC transporter periplasmic sulfonate-binding protein SsuA [Actinoplanes lobatus]|uniref:Sulfonate ABC transporter periplasmic sulfonate-binding protein SsuA n=1 Tax=Actinoplanes lobatus TaxID=113568 RepID=A0A7W7MIK4_9ACTN|nr:ABC transporter substrate-binding protein [Actinoplanes lobatus]MBB4751579.1 sulfonate transport system substrate-binding protein [Actinoplanes lobatus]GGN64786.1 sulfonate ABC transporter periplasmic sulfonate-binding protein SsuA [Actinoplanes lobatus]GIE43163.1 sulfonate ABC transporter periplasmic sulfonate-binding protein SsuA [Actinoplanes lobatus]